MSVVQGNGQLNGNIAAIKPRSVGIFKPQHFREGSECYDCQTMANEPPHDVKTPPLASTLRSVTFPQGVLSLLDMRELQHARE